VIQTARLQARKQRRENRERRLDLLMSYWGCLTGNGTELLTVHLDGWLRDNTVICRGGRKEARMRGHQFSIKQY
jgi:hypothetical protein